MKERPILFSGDMVNAILQGRKTQTRRIIKESFNGCLTNGGPHPCPNDPVVFHPGEIIPSPFEGEPDMVMKGDKVTALFHCSTLDSEAKCPYGQIGDILWCRETFKPKRFAGMELDGYDYKADHLKWLTENGQSFTKGSGCETGEKWKPSIFMPRAASRISLKITNIKVERIQDISEEDAIKEGVDLFPFDDNYKQAFERIWIKINGQDSWSSNPWVFAIEFEKIKK